MAATAWAHFTPYNDDPSVALRECQEREFAARAYQLPSDIVLDSDPQVLSSIAPDVSKLKDMLKVAKALDKAFADPDVDSTAEKKNLAEIEAFIHRIERKGFASAVTSFAKRSAKTAPKSIEELRRMAAEAGTHSILDIQRVSSEPSLGGATLLSDSQLQKLFGTVQPTQKMVKKVHQKGALAKYFDRWQAVYLVVYADGQPTGYFFAGLSGD